MVVVPVMHAALELSWILYSWSMPSMFLHTRSHLVVVITCVMISDKIYVRLLVWCLVIVLLAKWMTDVIWHSYIAVLASCKVILHYSWRLIIRTLRWMWVQSMNDFSDHLGNTKMSEKLGSPKKKKWKHVKKRAPLRIFLLSRGSRTKYRGGAGRFIACPGRGGIATQELPPCCWVALITLKTHRNYFVIVPAVTDD